MFDPEDDDSMTEEEYAALEARMTERGFMKDGKIDWEAVRATPTHSLDEFEDILEAHYDAQEEKETK